MADERMAKLARVVVEQSLGIKQGEKVLLDIWDNAEELAVALVNEVYKAGGLPFVNLESFRIKRAINMQISDEGAQCWYQYELNRMKDMDAYIAVRKQDNICELADVPKEQMAVANKYYDMLHLQQRCRSTRWCVLRYPTAAMAQQAGMSLEGFEDFFYEVCCLDYRKLAQAMEPLRDYVAKTDQVRILAEGTDITFSKKGRGCCICAGTGNLPDGEVCSSPDPSSVNGTIRYNIPSNYRGFTFEGVCFTFKDGRIIDVQGNDSARINSILDTDDGARFIGEFALGVNPCITRPIVDTLFDEKMAGSLHFTPGAGDTKVHWDLVQCHLAKYGGGEIWFDGTLVRKDGLFVIDELAQLNPERLKPVVLCSAL
jgi:aminopeptidase